MIHRQRRGVVAHSLLILAPQVDGIDAPYLLFAYSSRHGNPDGRLVLLRRTDHDIAFFDAGEEPPRRAFFLNRDRMKLPRVFPQIIIDFLVNVHPIAVSPAL